MMEEDDRAIPAMDIVKDITLNALGKPLPQAVKSQLQYLWRCAATLAVSSPASVPVSHNLSLQFAGLASKHDIQLPAVVKERLCVKCSVMLLPPFTCTVRVRPRSQRSGANRQPKPPAGKVKNQIVYHCSLCQAAMARPGVPRRPTSAASLPRPSIATIPITSAPTPAPAPAPTRTAASKKPQAVAAATPGSNRLPAHKSFSFRALNGLSTSAFASTGGSSSSTGGGLGDFVSFGSAPSVHAGDKRVSLVELEKERKKQKKKAGAGGGGGGGEGGMALSSIQRLLSQVHNGNNGHKK